MTQGVSDEAGNCTIGILMTVLFWGAGGANPSVGLSISAGEAAVFTGLSRLSHSGRDECLIWEGDRQSYI